MSDIYALSKHTADGLKQLLGTSLSYDFSHPPSAQHIAVVECGDLQTVIDNEQFYSGTVWRLAANTLEWEELADCWLTGKGTYLTPGEYYTAFRSGAYIDDEGGEDEDDRPVYVTTSCCDGAISSSSSSSSSSHSSSSSFSSSSSSHSSVSSSSSASLVGACCGGLPTTLWGTFRAVRFGTQTPVACCDSSQPSFPLVWDGVSGWAAAGGSIPGCFHSVTDIFVSCPGSGPAWGINAKLDGAGFALPDYSGERSCSPLHVAFGGYAFTIAGDSVNWGCTGNAGFATDHEILVTE